MTEDVELAMHEAHVIGERLGLSREEIRKLRERHGNGWIAARDLLLRAERTDNPRDFLNYRGRSNQPRKTAIARHS